MEDEYVEVATPGDMEVYRRLDAYADARLAPDPAAMRRIRAFVMAAAASRADGLRAAVPVAGAPTSLAQVREARSNRRLPRVATALLAASLTIAVAAGSAFAARPGGPLYEARLWVESVTLPASEVARAQAQLDRLDARLAEVELAVQAGDASAAAAALEAYADIVGDLDAQVSGDPSVGADIEDDVSRHLAILDALVSRVPPQASDALQLARDRSDNALDHIGNGSGNTPPRGPGDDNGNGGNGNGSGSSNGSGGSGVPGGPPDEVPGQGVPGSGSNATPKPPKTPNPAPAKTAKPKPTPPAPTPEADPTPQPGRTPKPGRTPNPGGGRPAPTPEPGDQSTSTPETIGAPETVPGAPTDGPG